MGERARETESRELRAERVVILRLRFEE